jgi:hypothetical protein
MEAVETVEKLAPQRVLELSTAHISPKTNQWLSEDEHGKLIVYDKHIYKVSVKLSPPSNFDFNLRR